MKQFQATTEEGSLKECGDDDASKRCCNKGMVERWICLRSSATLIPSVGIRERDLAEREVKLLKITEGRTEQSVERGDDILEETIAKDASEVAAEKPKKKRKRKPLLTASVDPMPDVGHVDFMSGLNLRTRPPHVRYVVSSDDFHHSGSYSEATSFVRSLVADAPVVTVAVTTTVFADVAAVSRSKTRDESKNLENIGDSASAGGANTDAANISKLNKPSTSSDSFYASQSLDTETKPPLSYTEAAEAICLRGQLTTMEAVDAAKDSELKDLKEKNFAVEGERDVMSEKIATLESTNVAKETELASLSS
ncbi:hypothetical protein Tco_0563659 [Tanacetum coccineum]